MKSGSVDVFGNDVVVSEEIVEEKRKKIGLFDGFLADINMKKTNLLRVDPEAHKDFMPFIVNRAMSMSMDTALFANEMNKRPDLSKQMVYDFYIHAVPKRKRYASWSKKVKQEDVEAVMEYFYCNEQRALETMSLLTMDDIEEIKKKIDKGGKR